MLKYQKSLVNSFIKNKHILWQLSFEIIRSRYLETVLGAIWVAIHPLLLIFIYWAVLTFGLKITVTGSQPFLLLLFCGIIPWMTISEVLSGTTSAITGRAYLIKKIAFPSEILPITYVIAGFFSQLFTIPALLLIMMIYHLFPGKSILFLPYFMLCSFLILSGMSWLISSLNVFYRDTFHVVAVILNIWFWLTPILWDPVTITPGYQYIILLNPMAYIISGYKYVFLGTPFPVSFWLSSVIFWGITAFFWGLGAEVFRRLKLSFADVL